MTEADIYDAVAEFRDKMKPYYQDDWATIFHGDCREILPTLPKVDLVLTDPPYGVGLKAKQHKWFRQDGEGYSLFKDTPEMVKEVVVPAIQVCISKFGRVVVTPGTRCLFFYPEPTDIGAVYNNAGTGSGSWGFICSTPILYYGTCPFLEKGLGRRANSYQQSPSDYSEKVDHPCPKPMGMFRWLVNRCSFEGQSILDPFMGSGTTLVAAKQLGRKSIGIELEEKYCEIAAKRLRFQTPPLFVDTPPPPQFKQKSLFENA